MSAKYGRVISEEEIQKRTSPVWPYKHFNPGRPVDPAEVDALLEGIVDIHVHGAPAGAWLPGRPTIVETCIEASKCKMGGLVFKDHNTMVNNCAIIVQDFLNRMQNDAAAKGEVFTPVKVYGGVVLNNPVGGLNVSAVKAALGYGKCPTIWLPSLDTKFQYELMGKPGGIEISQNHELVPELIQILDMLSDYNTKSGGEKCALSVCHISNDEKFDILRYVKKRGMNVPILIDHVTQELTLVSPEEAREMIDLGAYLEFAETACVPWPGMQDWIIAFDYSFNLIRDLIKEKGPDHLLLVTDGGQPGHDYIPGWKNFLRTLLAQGVSAEHIRAMSNDNPRRILGIG